MAKHDVSLSIPQQKLTKTDVEFVVRRDGETFGTLAVSRGSLVWFPKGTTYGHKIGWGKFDKFMKDNAPRYEAR